jgi:peptidoglycan/xylan/chitin deacetylase (PgdA/CDA1 family)
MASVSLDLDNKWAYIKTHGDAGWESFPSFLDTLVPRVLDFFKVRNLTITAFIVGQDAALKKNHDLLRSIAAAGHEIGNHSFRHEPWLHLYSEKQIEAELAMAEENIERATGQTPIGFRAPGHSVSRATLLVLKRRGYLYDASTLPNYLAPLARMYYFMNGTFTVEQKRRLKLIGGTFREPIKPYQWRIGNGTLMEIPVTTMPILKIPIHLSYLMCLRVFSSSLALQYFNVALKICQWNGVQPSLLLHPTDFLGRDDVTELPFVPGMNLPSEKKLEFVSDVLHCLSTQFTVLTVQQHAQEAAQIPELPVVEARLRATSSPEQQPV